jgi:uncharacterized protein (TIGR02246 family)
MWDEGETTVIAQTRQPYLKTSQDVDFMFFGAPTVLHATGDATDGRFCLTESLTMPPGLASPYHTHHNEDEAFYVLEGELAIVCDGTWMHAGPGTWVYGPRGIPHGFKVVGSKPARMLLMCAPAGFEKFVLELCSPLGAPAGPPDMAKLMDAAKRFNIDIHGPLPEEKTAVDRVREAHVAAVNAGDVEGAAGLFAPDGVMLPPGQPALDGGAAIRGWFTYVFANFRLEAFDILPGAVERNGDLSIEHGSWKGTFQPKDGSQGRAAGGSYLTVYRHLADGSVCIVRDTFNDAPA